MDENLSIPHEIPWKLVATNQVLKLGEPEDATISIFYYEPKLDSLSSAYPDERIVYLKFTLSVCPSFPGASTLGSIGQRYFAGALPVRHVMFDVAVTPEPFETGGIRPYFHSAAPLRRTMVETGVVGLQIAEAEAEAIMMGRSGSQLLERVSSHTTSSGLEREDVHTLQEEREITNRDASQERRELLSHITHVDNVITLLSAKHVGSPYLRFNLWPRPITSLLGDERDPERWYQEVLRRRSSGIEGIQEFIAVVAAPRGQTFCLQSRMRRICVLDKGPPARRIHRPIVFNSTQMNNMLSYLHRRYPRGTPIDDLDVNLWPQINEKYGEEAQQFVRPTVTDWEEDYVNFNGSVHQDIRCYFRVPHREATLDPRRSILYKTSHAVWLEKFRAEQEEDLARAPLEHGLVLNFETTVNTCVGTSPSSSSFSHRSEAPRIIAFEPEHDRPLSGQPLLDQDFEASPIHSWDSLEDQLRLALNNVDFVPPDELKLDDPRVVRLLLERLEALNPDDPRNVSLDDVATLFQLDQESLRALDDAGACDLRSVAELLNAASEFRDNCADLQERRARDRLVQEASPEKKVCTTTNEPVDAEGKLPESLIPNPLVNRIRSQMGASLRAAAEAPGYDAER